MMGNIFRMPTDTDTDTGYTKKKKSQIKNKAWKIISLFITASGKWMSLAKKSNIDYSFSPNLMHDSMQPSQERTWSIIAQVYRKLSHRSQSIHKNPGVILLKFTPQDNVHLLHKSSVSHLLLLHPWHNCAWHASIISGKKRKMHNVL